MKIFSYDTETRLLLRRSIMPDSMAERLLQKPGYTTVEPPERVVGQWHRFVDGAWTTEIDLRGEMWHDPNTGEKVIITQVGEVAPEGWVYGFPPKPDSQESIGRSVDV